MQFELTKDFLSNVSQAIVEKDNLFIINNIIDLHPADIADVMDYVNLEEAQYIYQLLEDEKAADVLVKIDEDVREKFLESLSAKQIAESIEKMDSDDATDLLQDLKINSAHLIDIVLDVEEAFDIEIDDESVEKMITVKDSVDTILACVTAAV